ncbi:hypothetical protein ASE21_11335 [Flavobacterium sp. Root901]|uniref:hypothetical protein n=1 Tax=Flavobacterium sp. Root901 TaxID=1736605 RepID=UPI00070AD9C5|nr:hypothetical protein [Flavobacterium sp. Root901]KRD10300.1 hypothetical protein ASE21_11335 [Flavobacterium sp. Root901]
MKTIYKLEILVFILLTALFISCKSSSASGTSVSTESDAIKAGDSTSINTGTKGTTRANEGNEDRDPEPGDVNKK